MLSALLVFVCLCSLLVVTLLVFACRTFCASAFEKMVLNGLKLLEMYFKQIFLFFESVDNVPVRPPLLPKCEIFNFF